MTSKKACIILLFILLLRFSNCIDIITAIACTGSTTYSGDNSQATAAGLAYSYAVCVDAAGGQLYLTPYY